MTQRMGMVIRLKPEAKGTYLSLHAEPWPEMDDALRAAHISHYSIYLREPENLLFGTWEYDGTDFDADMAILGAKDITKRWLALTDPCQSPLETATTGEWWSYMPEIYRLD